MNFINCLLDTVLTWEIPEEGFVDAVKTQARQMAGFDPDELSCLESD